MGTSAAALCGSRQTLDRRLAKRGGRAHVFYLIALSTGLSLLLATPFAPFFSGRRHTGPPAPGLSSLPTGLQAAASAALGAASTVYAASPVRAGFAAVNPAQRLRLRFGADGVQVHAGHATMGLALDAIGQGDSLRAVTGVAPRSHANRVTYRHPGFTEWFANGPLGLEQGFSIQRAPSRVGGEPLTLVMGLSGGIRASVLAGRRSLALSGAGGASLRYGGLTATDARGHELRAWLELRGRRLMLRVDARRARYPIEIDPFVQQGDSLTGGGEWAGGDFGASVALSADGSTALIGAPSDDFGVGAAWVFTRTGSTWSQQGNKLTGAEERGDGEFGTAVALSADGNTALIGGIGDDKDTGAVWVFTHPLDLSQQGEKLVGSSPRKKGASSERALSAKVDRADRCAVLRHGARLIFTRTVHMSQQSTDQPERESAKQLRTSVACHLTPARVDRGAMGHSQTGAAWCSRAQRRAQQAQADRAKRVKRRFGRSLRPACAVGRR